MARMVLRPVVRLVLDTYEDLREAPGPVVEWLDLVRGELTDDLVKRMPRTWVDELRVLAMLRDSDRLSRKKYTPANWDKTRSQVLAGELDKVWIEYLSGRLEVEADLDPVVGRQHSLLIAYPQLPDGVTEQIQDALVGALRRGAQLLRAATGYLTVDDSPCPYEAVMGCEIENWERYEEQVRGYYWGNILSEYHIGQLGGLGAVLRDAPFVVSEDISTDGHQLVYLQSTDRLEDWPADAVVVARDYLLPLLPGGTPDPEIAAKARHVIEDAPIPERPPVPGTRYWEFLEGVRSRTGTPLLPWISTRSKPRPMRSAPGPAGRFLNRRPLSCSSTRWRSRWCSASLPMRRSARTWSAWLMCGRRRASREPSVGE
jgi:hypothetical protein